MSFNNPVDQPILSVYDPSKNQTFSYPFVQNLANVINKTPAPPIDLTTLDPYKEMMSEQGFQGQVANFFASFNTIQSPTGGTTAVPQYNLPLTWSDFLSQFQRFMGQGVTGSTTGPLFNAFLTSYEKFVNYPADFSTLNVSSSDIQNQFMNSFTHFLQTYPFPDKTQFSFGTAEQFFTNWATYMTATATVQNTTGAATGLPAFEQIWTSFGFPQSGFQDAITKFYQNMLKQTGNGNAANGYFIPSQLFSSWMESVKDQYLHTMIISSVPGDGNEVLVIDRILRLLIQLVGILQNITASQAQRLTFLTKWQSAYNNLLTDIPTFTQGDGSAIDSNPTPTNSDVVKYGTDLTKEGKDEATQRDKVNEKLSALQDKTRARRDSIGDQAKAMQSLVNQSQTTSNAQTDMVTAFLTTLDTILAAIYK